MTAVEWIGCNSNRISILQRDESFNGRHGMWAVMMNLTVEEASELSEQLRDFVGGIR